MGDATTDRPAHARTTTTDREPARVGRTQRLWWLIERLGAMITALGYLRE